VNLTRVRDPRKNLKRFDGGEPSRHTEIAALRVMSQENLQRVLHQDHELALILPNLILTSGFQDAESFFQEADRCSQTWLEQLGEILSGPANRRWVKNQSAHEDTGFLTGLYLSKGELTTRRRLERIRTQESVKASPTRHLKKAR
jgi:hypothetical protein